MVTLKPSKVTRRTVGDQILPETSAKKELQDFEFEPVENTPETPGIMEFVNEACKSIESMVNSSPANAGEVDGVQIVGYMDGVRVVRRLKKKLESDVEYLYCGEGLEEVGACASQSLHSQLDYDNGSDEDAPK